LTRLWPNDRILTSYDIVRNCQNCQLIVGEQMRGAILIGVSVRGSYSKKKATRNEVHSRVGGIRAQSETCSGLMSVRFLEKSYDLPIVKSGQKPRRWCLAA